jgi:hypothetical protein
MRYVAVVWKVRGVTITMFRQAGSNVIDFAAYRAAREIALHGSGDDGWRDAA